MNKDTLVLRLYAKDIHYTAIRRHGLKPRTQINPGDIKLYTPANAPALLAAVNSNVSMDVWEIRIPKGHPINDSLSEYGEGDDQFWLLTTSLPPELVVNVMRIEKNSRYRPLK